jgi:hypothetical protein
MVRAPGNSAMSRSMKNPLLVWLTTHVNPATVENDFRNSTSVTLNAVRAKVPTVVGAIITTLISAGAEVEQVYLVVAASTEDVVVKITTIIAGTMPMARNGGVIFSQNLNNLPFPFKNLGSRFCPLIVMI